MVARESEGGSMRWQHSPYGLQYSQSAESPYQQCKITSAAYENFSAC